MDKVVLFDNKQGEYGVYDTVSELLNCSTIEL